jgi:nucleoside-diphosphate-sugar epimerase
VNQKILILGASGRLGAAAAAAFQRAGWEVIAHVRTPSAHSDANCIHYISNALAETDAIARAAAGACLVLYAINPPYPRWKAEALPLLDHAIAIAEKLNATLLFPGNVYNFGATMPAQLTESTTQSAGTIKGKIRIEMERSLQRASERGVQSIILRAGDFFGAGAGSWFDLAIAKNINVGKLTFPGPLDVAHAWAYLPDLARAFVDIAPHRKNLPMFASFNFPGHTLTGHDWIREIQPIAENRGWVKQGAPLKIGSIPWGMMKLCAPFVPMWRELIEMQYLWTVPHALAGDSLAQQLGAPPQHTPFAEALPAALKQLGHACT